jgi:hypothetical protein
LRRRARCAASAVRTGAASGADPALAAPFPSALKSRKVARISPSSPQRGFAARLTDIRSTIGAFRQPRWSVRASSFVIDVHAPGGTKMAGSAPSNLKIFCIGLQKTGTSSLRALLQRNGIPESSYSRQSRDIFLYKNYEKVLEHYDTATFHSNAGSCLMYKLAFEKYGALSRYILTIRKDSRLWVESLKRHSLYAHPIKHKNYRMFGRFYPHGFENEHMAYYERHIAEVVRFFSERNASDLLLILRVDEPGAVGKLSRFLGVDFDADEFPRENVSTRDRKGFSNRFKKHYNVIAQTLYGYVAPRLATRPPRQALPPEPPLERYLARPREGVRPSSLRDGVADHAGAV